MDHRTRCRRFQWVSRTKKLVVPHTRATAVSVPSKPICSTWTARPVQLQSISRTASRMVQMVISSTRLSRHLRWRESSSITVLKMGLVSQRSRHFLKILIPSISSWNKLRESRSTQDRKLRTDLVNTTRTASTFCLLETSLILKDSISTKKDMTRLEVTTIRWPASTFQVQSTHICPCKRTKATTRVSTEAQTRRHDGALTTAFKKTIHSLERTMEASMLIRTTKASMVSSTLILSLTRAGGTTRTPETDTTATLSRTSTEGTLQTGLMGSTLRQRIKSSLAITMIKCQPPLRTHSRGAIISRIRSHSSQLIWHSPMTNLVSLRNQRVLPRSLKTTTNCWWPSCEMGGGE